MRIAGAIFLCLWVLSCGPSTPEAGTAAVSGGVWRKLRADHIELTTDLPESDAVEALTALERARATLLAVAWPTLSPSRTTARFGVTVFANGLEFERYFGRHADGLSASSQLFLWGRPSRWEHRGKWSDDATTSVLRHELAHRLAASVYARQPRWFAEGFAQFLETVVLSEDGKTATLGRINREAQGYYNAIRSLGVADALAWGSAQAEVNERTEAGLYGLSWVLVHWMYNKEPARFAAFQKALADGTAPDKAFSEAFAGLSYDDIEKALYDYQRFGGFREYYFDVPAEVAHVTRVDLTEADVLALQADIALIGASMREDGNDLRAEAEQQLRRALALEPGNPRALALVTGLSKAQRVARLREQIAQHPEDGEAWLWLGGLLDGTDEGEAALRKAVALLPGDVKAYNGLAWHLVKKGKGEEALPLATKAAMIAPWDAAVLDTYAAALFAVGRCADALRTQTKAVERLPERKRGSAASRSYLEALARYRGQCPEGAASAATQGSSAR